MAATSSLTPSSGESRGRTGLELASADTPVTGRSALRVSGLTKRFGDLTALDSIDLTVEPGTTTVLLGPSGSGKSTLLRSLNLLEKPDAGTLDFGAGPIEVSGPLSRAQIGTIRRQSTMVFQQFNLFPHLSALDNVTLAPIRSRGMSRNEAEEIGREALAKVGLAEKADAYPVRLSGGQQQRVAIARALALRPDYLLFDEPTSALDPELAAEVIAVLADLAAEQRTLVVVTHSLQFARRVADRVVFLENGSIAFNGAPDDFFASEDPRLRRFLDVVGSV